MFNQQVSASASHPWGGAGGFAMQHSIFGASAITMTGDVAASGNSRNFGSGRSELQVTFNLLSTSHLELSGILDAIPSWHPDGTTYVQLERVGGPVLARFDGSGIVFGGPSWRVDFSGDHAFRTTVEAGQYKLSALLAVGTDLQQSAGVEFVLSGIPTPGSAAVLAMGALATLRRRR